MDVAARTLPVALHPEREVLDNGNRQPHGHGSGHKRDPDGPAAHSGRLAKSSWFVIVSTAAPELACMGSAASAQHPAQPMLRALLTSERLQQKSRRLRSALARRSSPGHAGGASCVRGSGGSAAVGPATGPCAGPTVITGARPAPGRMASAWAHLHARPVNGPRERQPWCVRWNDAAARGVGTRSAPARRSGSLPNARASGHANTHACLRRSMILYYRARAPIPRFSSETSTPARVHAHT